MEKLRYTVFGIAFGMILGVGGAHSFTVATGSTPRAPEGGAWTAYHSAIPSQPQEEPSPTF